MREPKETLLVLSDMTPCAADCDRVSSAESEPSSRAWLERTWIIEARPSASGPPRRTTADDAEQRQVVALEDVRGLADPLVGIAVEVVDHLDMGDGVEKVLGERLARPGADVAMRQLRRERHHVGNEVADRVLVEGLSSRRR